MIRDDRGESPWNGEMLDAWEHGGEPRCWDAFAKVWRFAQQHFIAPAGEWRVLLDRAGGILDGNLGNEWKVSYHTGRALLECVTRLERCAEK